MPVRDSTNNNILPANSRSADVAEKAIQEIIPTQQARYYNAFRVQGVQAIMYHRLGQGRPCSCQSSHKVLNSRLDKDGKASEGTINELLTGMSFKISGYGTDSANLEQQKQDNITSPAAPTQKHAGSFDIRTQDIEYPNSNLTPGYGDNGPNNDFSIEDLVSNFDASTVGFSDVNCTVCYGTGFVGGFSLFQGYRQVVAVQDFILQDPIDFAATPWTAETNRFSFTLVLPRGALGVDSFRVYNNRKSVNANFTIDGVAVKNVGDILKKCDGLPHVVECSISSPTIVTHFECQLSLSNQSTYFEFPKLAKSSDLSKINPTEPFQIVLSPNIPKVREQDIIVESMYGMHLMVQSVNPWNSRQRNVLGWECNVRVLQPQEWYTLLPLRGRVKTKTETTNIVQDNVTGFRRT